MRLIENYTPPTADDLFRLRENLGYTAREMGDLAGLAGGSQWRKYDGGKEPRMMSAPMLFFIAAQLVLEKKQLDAVLAKMQEIGAEI